MLRGPRVVSQGSAAGAACLPTGVLSAPVVDDIPRQGATVTLPCADSAATEGSPAVFSAVIATVRTITTVITLSGRCGSSGTATTDRRRHATSLRPVIIPVVVPAIVFRDIRAGGTGNPGTSAAAAAATTNPVVIQPTVAPRASITLATAAAITAGVAIATIFGHHRHLNPATTAVSLPRMVNTACMPVFVNRGRRAVGTFSPRTTAAAATATTSRHHHHFAISALEFALSSREKRKTDRLFRMIAAA